MNSSVALDTAADANASTTYTSLPVSTRADLETTASSGTVQHLPVAVQAAFRRKVFAIFTLQLLFVMVVMLVIRWTPSLRDAWTSILDSSVIILLPIGAVLVLLVLLYKMRAKLPWNWLLLALFSVALSFVYSGVDFLLDTTVCVVCSGATFALSLLMTVLSGVMLRESESRRQEKLCSPFTAGLISFVVVAAGVFAFYGIFSNEFISTIELVCTLSVELLITLWFAHDAERQFKILTPDEYMVGVISFYVDLGIIAISVMGAFGGGGSPQAYTGFASMRSK